MNDPDAVAIEEFSRVGWANTWRELTEMRTALKHLQSQIEEISSILPPTYYAFLPLEKRIRFMVEGWNKSVSVAQELQARVEELEVALQN